MKTLRYLLDEGRCAHTALAHFNISDSNQLKAIAETARAAGLPAAIGLSEGERAFFPLPQVRGLIDAYRVEGVQLFLNADHTYSFEKARAAIDAGVDSIVVDGAALPYDENVALVQSVVAYARASGRDVLVEGELGYIGASSKILDALPEGAVATEAMMTTPAELERFVDEAHVDAVAPAVGNIHGMIRSGQPKLSMERIRALADASPVPLVLHGGSGSSDAEFTGAILAGISMIHINTELRLTYRRGLERGLRELPDELSPYRFLAPAVEDMQAYVAEKLRLFAGA